jgi:2-polyprenyl-6-methoxyphenol hydroxylase-like FAD-dependent oxidoreductase
VHDEVAYWFTNIPRGDEPRRGELEDLDISQWMTTIRSLHADDPPVVRLILDAGSSALGAWPLYDMPKLEQWHTHNVCLIGDAAHAVSPSTGQGASLAIEDAAVLTRCLRTAATPQTAFAQFERERKDRTERVMKFGRQIGNRKSPSALGRIFRDLTLKHFIGMGAKATEEQYGYLVDAPVADAA